MFKKILIAVALLLVVLIVFVATRPATYHVERSARMAASPAAVYAQVADFRAWERWSPWEGRDPDMRKTFEGPSSGAGASYHWVGNDEVGEGRMTITEADPGRRVEIDLEFIKPWASRNVTTFELEPDGAGTRVVWHMDGRNDFMGKAMSLVMDFDQMIGADFERGLGSLEAAAVAHGAGAGEAPAAPDASEAPAGN
jgi:uncharacterized protein YndB with AHSA1/START domain